MDNKEKRAWANGAVAASTSLHFAVDLLVWDGDEPVTLWGDEPEATGLRVSTHDPIPETVAGEVLLRPFPRDAAELIAALVAAGWPRHGEPLDWAASTPEEAAEAYRAVADMIAEGALPCDIKLNIGGA